MCNSFEVCGHDDLARVLQTLSGDDDVVVPAGVPEGGVAFPKAFAPALRTRPAFRGGGSLDADGVQLEGAGVGALAAGSVPLEVCVLGFGLPVEWKKRGTVFNARLDSLARGTGMWGDALAHRRCVVPCAGFYESHRSETMRSPKTGRQVKRRCSFASADGEPLLLGAVYDGEHFAIVTTDPNADVACVHDRMPLVLTTAEARLWLDPAAPLDCIIQLADRAHVRLHSHAERGTPADAGADADAPPDYAQLTLPL